MIVAPYTIETQLNRVLEGAERQLLPVHGTPVRIYAQNAEGLPSILLRLTSECVLPDFIHGTQGIQVSLDRECGTGYHQIALRSKTRSMNGAFYALAYDLFDVAAQESEEQKALDSVLARFEEFRRLMQLDRQGLGEEEVRGLIAELKTLQLLISKKHLSPEQALLSWHGPYGANKDIVCGTSAIEVKSLRLNATDIKISSTEQLDSNNLLVYLSTIYLEKSADTASDEAFSLRELVSEFYTMFEDDWNLTKQFEAALNNVGYDEEGLEYPDWKFRVRNQKIYEVVDSFPRIRTADVPHGVRGLQYSLIIGDIEEFEISFEEVEIGN